jgi:uncharacterized protein
MAKAPVAGRVKTRLCPPCTPEEAASIAEASLQDTFAAAMPRSGTHNWNTIAVLDGEPGPWLPEGVAVIAQVTGLLGVRLDAAFHAAIGNQPQPCVLIAMDTPQVTTDQLAGALAQLSNHDCVIGMAEDGGYWLIGFNRYVPHAFDNVTMSVDTTGAEQVAQLNSLGLKIAYAQHTYDIDEADDVERLTQEHPSLLTSQRWREVRKSEGITS